MKLGFVSAIVADLSFEEVIDFASGNKFDCVELLCWPLGKAERRYAGVTHVDVDALDDRNISKIIKYLESKNISVSALGYYPNPLEDDAEKSSYYVEHVKKVIDASSILNINIMNTFIGREHTKNLDYNFDKFKEIWPVIVKHAEQKNVKMGIENCPMFFSNDEWPGGKNLAYCPVNWRRMFEIIDSPYFGLNYDPSHLIWQQMDYINPLYEFKDKIFHVHIKDAKIFPNKLNDVGILANPLEYHLPKIPGLGDIDWGCFFSALTDIGYDGPVVIEIEDRAFEDSLESRKRALRQSRDYIRQFVASESEV